MNEMKRRVAAILEFVSKMQGDKSVQSNNNNSSHAPSSGPSGSRTPNGLVQGGSCSGSGGNSSGNSAGGATENEQQQQPEALLKGIEAGLTAAVQANGERGPAAGRDFRDMPSGEMMHALTRELVGWQTVYGKYGGK
jgi:hypothetical protein